MKSRYLAWHQSISGPYRRLTLFQRAHRLLGWWFAGVS